MFHKLLRRTIVSRFAIIVLVASYGAAFNLQPRSSCRAPTGALRMGFFGFGGQAEERKATAAHVMVADESLALSIKAEIESGALTLPEAAAKYSTCQGSSAKGGKLGMFSPGELVGGGGVGLGFACTRSEEFDAVVFDPSVPIETVHGPVRTEYGWHLLQIGLRKGKDGPY